jgi:excinuclease ABC subunit B
VITRADQDHRRLASFWFRSVCASPRPQWLVGAEPYRGSMRVASDIVPKTGKFEVVSDFQPSGDQPTAIDDLERRIRAGQKDVVLLGATGTGKSATAAWLIERLQRPTLVMAPNKTLAAQLANELREMLPNNAVEYFVSYYDYYQPEAYVPQTDTYIEKDSSINSEVERLRHSATNSLLTRRDVVVVATVSCIYGLGTPQEYVDRSVRLHLGQQLERDLLLRHLVGVQYTRNDLSFTRGTFRVRGDTVEIFPMYEELAIRVEMFGDDIERLYYLHPLTGEVMREVEEVFVFPASHYTAGPERMARALQGIELELADRLAELEKHNKLLEAQRLRMRTTYDIEMMRQVGFCSGIENYSRHIDGRAPGSPPNCLLDYFPDDFLLVMDESHNTVPQTGGMYEGDISRKRTLVEHGFRLPSAMDNRPLKFEEFVDRIGQTVYLSATPGPYELGRSRGEFVEQVIRPTGLVDPEVIVKPTKGQIDDLVSEIRERAQRDERILVTTLTKKMAEDLTDYLLELGVRVRYLHSEVDTLRRVELLRELRTGEFDVLVGINLLREGLDLPEVSLVSILDADKEGFLRSGTSLIQTIGRAARHVSGQVHMYADTITPSMQRAIDETNRRRAKQIAFNTEHGLDPQPLRKRIADITDMLAREAADTDEMLGGSGRSQSRGKSPVPGRGGRGASGRGVSSRGVSAGVVGIGTHADRQLDISQMPRAELADLIQQLNAQMLSAARELQFEVAARLRDEIAELKKELRGMDAAGVR